MRCSRASADPACDTGRQKHSARCLADDGCSVSATEAARAEGARGTRRGRRSGGEEAPGLRAPRFTAIACWITNTGNLKRPPVRSLLLIHSSSPLSKTIRYSPLLSALFLYLVLPSILPPSSIIPWLNICFGRLKATANVSLLTGLLDPGLSATPSPRRGPFKHAPEAACFGAIVRASTAMCRISERSRGGSGDKQRVCECVCLFD